MDEQTNTILGLVLGVIMIVITWATISKRERQLDNPNDDSVVYSDQSIDTSKLQSGGEYLLRVLRQSGNMQKDAQILSPKELATKAAVSTFRRAKIGYVFITINTNVELFFRRPYHHHGGSAEGRKVGSVEIYKIK